MVVEEEVVVEDVKKNKKNARDGEVNGVEKLSMLSVMRIENLKL